MNNEGSEKLVALLKVGLSLDPVLLLLVWVDIFSWPNSDRNTFSVKAASTLPWGLFQDPQDVDNDAFWFYFTPRMREGGPCFYKMQN